MKQIGLDGTSLQALGTVSQGPPVLRCSDLLRVSPKLQFDPTIAIGAVATVADPILHQRERLGLLNGENRLSDARPLSCQGSVP